MRALQGRETVRLLVADDARHGGGRAPHAAPDAASTRRGHRVPRTSRRTTRGSATPARLREERDAAGRRTALASTSTPGAASTRPGSCDATAASAALTLKALACRRGPASCSRVGRSTATARAAVLTTESCLLHPTASRAGRGRRWRSGSRDWLGTERVVWLSDGIAGDDTDGHVDDVARFVHADDGRGRSSRASGDDAGRSRRTGAGCARRGTRTASRFEQVLLPMPPVHHRASTDSAARRATRTSISPTGSALVPTFGAASDARALDVLRELLARTRRGRASPARAWCSASAPSTA